MCRIDKFELPDRNFPCVRCTALVEPVSLNLLVILSAIILTISSFWQPLSLASAPDHRTPEYRSFSLENRAERRLDLPAQFPQWNTASDPMTGTQAISGVTASAVFAVDITSDTLLYSYNADLPVAPASTLKMITAITTLTVLEPDAVIEVAQGDLVDTQVYSNAQLRAGDWITVRDLLAGLMLPSGGDAANALARVAGSQLGPTIGQSPMSRFVEEMNRVAEDLGMTGSNFVNPDGPDVPQQFSTARDLAIAGAAVLDDDLLALIVGTSGWTITVNGPNARTFTVNNTNELIGIARVHGIKTGTTGQAGESVVLATRRNGNQIITVVMGSTQRYADTLTLLQYLDDRIRWVEFDASDDFPDIARSADELGFVLVVPFVRPYLHSEADQIRAELVLLGPRPRGTLPVRWGHVVFLNDNVELIEVPVLRAGVSGN